MSEMIQKLALSLLENVYIHGVHKSAPKVVAVINLIIGFGQPIKLKLT